MINIRKFLEWIDRNNMHVLLSPSVNHKRVASLYESRYSGAFGRVTKSMNYCDIYYSNDYNSFNFAIGDHGSASLCAYGEDDSEAVTNLCKILTDKRKDEDHESITKITNDFLRRSKNAIEIVIPTIEEFME